MFHFHDSSAAVVFYSVSPFNTLKQTVLSMITEEKDCMTTLYFKSHLVNGDL